MQQTKHYQLSQWEKEDRILMEDFNGDNAKVDAALRAEEERRADAVAALDGRLTAEAARLEAAKAGFVDAGTFTAQLNSAADALTLSTPGVDYGGFLAVVLEVAFPYSTGSWHIQPNGQGDMGRCAGNMRFFALPMRNPDARAVFYPVGGLNTPQMSQTSANCTFGELNRFVFGPEYAEYTVQGQASIRVVGVR